MTSHYIGNSIKPLAEMFYLSSIVIRDSIGHTTEPTGKGSSDSFEFGIGVISFCFSIFKDFTVAGLMALVDKEVDQILGRKWCLWVDITKKRTRHCFSKEISRGKVLASGLTIETGEAVLALETVY